MELGTKTSIKVLKIIWLAIVCHLLVACNQEVILPEADVQASVEAGIATTGQSTAVVPTTISRTLVATWTAIPAVNVNTPTPNATVLPPPTSTPIPTAIPTETPTIPTNTPRPTDTPLPTDTPIPPTNTAAPAQPTSPPPEPTVPANPVLGGNVLRNPSFEGGWYHMWGIPELQLPNEWGFEWDEGPTGFGNEPWDIWVRPETRVLPDIGLPPSEQSLFIRDGQYTIKMFKGNGAVSFRVFQDIALDPGTYVFQIYVFPDLVIGYDGNNKLYASTDPPAGEVRFIAPDGGTGWIVVTPGTWNGYEHTFTLSGAQTVRVGVGFRGRFALNNNGWFFDQWALNKIEG